ncbi:MAG TPA: hypothetical protein VFH64_13690 [Amnibacterium sp.]|nr:hypothetical protein [Amnibacterium sp.]
MTSIVHPCALLAQQPVHDDISVALEWPVAFLVLVHGSGIPSYRRELG